MDLRNAVAQGVPLVRNPRGVVIGCLLTRTRRRTLWP